MKFSKYQQVLTQYQDAINILSNWVKNNTKTNQPLPETNFKDFENIGLIYCNDGCQREGLENLVLFQYSKIASFRKATEWNDVEKISRGIIFEKETGKLIALSFPKFYNYSELPEDNNITNDDIDYIEYKEDGSLGICFYYNNNWWVSTHGSLGSEQGVHATNVLRKKYNYMDLNYSLTYLVEIVYPDNRIVTDYGDVDDLYLLDFNAINSISDDTFVLFSLVDKARQVFNNNSIYSQKMLDLLNTFDKSKLLDEINNFCVNNQDYNFEGFVVTLKNGRKIKFKTFAYVSIHRSKFNITFKQVKHLYINSEESLYQWKKELPNEFFHLVDNYILALHNYIDPIMEEGKNNALECLSKINISKEQHDTMDKAEIDNLRKLLYPIISTYHKEKQGMIWNYIKKQDVEKTFKNIAMPLTWKEVSGKNEEEEDLC